ncbi:hypothetical protein [Nostoc sp. CCY 9925]|uniref:hypothetical protein n=1 Tax=Nostoc sp. CCY 9925 TaxID=3103865 RepID=UPI0039C6FF81
MINEVKTAKPEDCLVAGQIAALMGKRSLSYPALAKILTPMGLATRTVLLQKTSLNWPVTPLSFLAITLKAGK